VRILILLAFIQLGCLSSYPTPQEISTANYGNPPETSDTIGLARNKLKAMGYFDPNGAEIENCTEIKKMFIKDKQGSDYSRWDSRAILYGYGFYCDVNSSNRFGAKTGFSKTLLFFPAHQ